LKKNLFVLLTIFLLGSLALVGCSSEESSQGNANEGQSVTEGDEEVTIRVWFGRGDFIPEDHFDSFHEKHPNIKVETDVIPLEQSTSDFIRNFNAGNEPDIFQTYHENVGALAKQGALYDMTSHYQKWEKEDAESYNKIMSQAFDITSYDGKVHGLGVHMGPRWNVYRSDLFEEAGLSAPETWDDVLEAGRILRDGGYLENGQYAYAIVAGAENAPNWFQSQIQAMGGQYTDGIPNINSEAGIYLIDFYQTLKREKLIHPESIAWQSGEMRGAFIGGNAAMATIGDNIFPIIQEDLSPYGEKWKATVQPYRPGAQDEWRPNASSWPMLVSANTEHPEEVTEVLKYLIDTDIVREVAHRYQPTTNKEVMEEAAYFEAKPWQEELAEAFSQAENIPSSLVHQQVMSTLLDLMQEALEQPDADPSEIAQKYQKQLDTLNN
jgi:ABC-type glycerol-3-phosphate transport system substrate-binding protein